MGDIILDAGCGVGRDTRCFIREGFRVISFDASIEMVKLCKQYPFAYCTHATFDSIHFAEKFNGVWACASLIHLDSKQFSKALFNLYQALKPGGILYLSIKDKQSSIKNANRKTYYYTEEFVRKILTEELIMKEIKTW